jgi:hypothetical protein
MGVAGFLLYGFSSDFPAACPASCTTLVKVLMHPKGFASVAS